ncbi:MAG: hypothetical protein GC136_08330 [Alphaproteobacteria bacterium]|nr:hypothetical protein [Alphaproteobacteria bacterium]
MVTQDFNRRVANTTAQCKKAATKLHKKDSEMLFFMAYHARRVLNSMHVGGYLEDEHSQLMADLSRFSRWRELHKNLKKANTQTRHMQIVEGEELFVKLERVLMRAIRGEDQKLAEEAKEFLRHGQWILLASDEIMFRPPPEGVYRMRWHNFPAVNPWLILHFCVLQLHTLIQDSAPLQDAGVFKSAPRLQAAIAGLQESFEETDMKGLSEKSAHRYYEMGPGDICSYEKAMMIMRNVYTDSNEIARALERGKGPDDLVQLADNINSLSSPLKWNSPIFIEKSQGDIEESAKNIIDMNVWRKGRRFG